MTADLCCKATDVHPQPCICAALVPVPELVEHAPLAWHYGPTAEDPNPGSMWCCDCGNEVWYLKSGPGEGGYICRGCGRQADE